MNQNQKEIDQLMKITGDIDYLFQEGVRITPEETKIIKNCATHLLAIVKDLKLRNWVHDNIPF